LRNTGKGKLGGQAGHLRTWQRPLHGYTKQEIEAVEKLTPLRRWGGPDEIAKAVPLLVETDSVKGEVFRVDGCRHLA
jgi:NAD(P)-dependent dehydrogenase (short-subunit alcohol dehydrogenase family)